MEHRNVGVGKVASALDKGMENLGRTRNEGREGPWCCFQVRSVSKTIDGREAWPS